MKPVRQQLEVIKIWLERDAFPLWLSAGHDPINGGFVESLDRDGSPTQEARRAMVQSRQIFSIRCGLRLGLVTKAKAEELIHSAAQTLLRRYRLESGAFMRSINVNGQPVDTAPDLYTQAFMLFGFAHAYAVTGEPRYQEESLALLNYLRSERQHSAGGFTELENGKVVFRSNPHMHLLEAAIAWSEADPKQLKWPTLVNEIAELCLHLFIDSQTGLLAEDFNEIWQPKKSEGHFFWEPGHQYEWAWLLGVGKAAPLEVRERLFDRSEAQGINSSHGTAWDSVWSDGRPRALTSRFWPQCERIKAALQLAKENPTKAASYLRAADEAVAALFKYFPSEAPALWRDTLEESGHFDARPSKSSSLYHIVGALVPYLEQRLDW